MREFKTAKEFNREFERLISEDVSREVKRRELVPFKVNVSDIYDDKTGVEAMELWIRIGSLRLGHTVNFDKRITSVVVEEEE